MYFWIFPIAPLSFHAECKIHSSFCTMCKMLLFNTFLLNIYLFLWLMNMVLIISYGLLYHIVLLIENPLTQKCKMGIYINLPSALSFILLFVFFVFFKNHFINTIIDNCFVSQILFLRAALLCFKRHFSVIFGLLGIFCINEIQ